jgi:GAF domain-containing protein
MMQLPGAHQRVAATGGADMTGPDDLHRDRVSDGADGVAAAGSDSEPAPHTTAERLRLVSGLARLVTARHDLSDVLSATLSGVRQLVEFGGGSIQLLDDEGWIRLAAADPTPTEEVLSLRIPLGSSIGGRVILTERPIYLPDVLAEPMVARGQDDDMAPPLPSRVSPGGVRSYYGVPLLADGRAIGLLQIDAPEADAWHEEDRLLLLAVAPVVSAAIQNARAYARVAVLTANRRRESERQGLIARIVDTDIDSAIAALVALSDDNPLIRGQVDQLTVAVARIRGALADAAATGRQVPPSRRGKDSSDEDDGIDLRADDKTRT